MVNRFKALFVVGLVLGAVTFGTVVALDLAGSDGVAIDNGVPLGAKDYNATITVYGDTNASLDGFSPSSGTVEVVTEEGNLTMSALGSTHVEVLNTAITGSQTKLTGITAGSTWIEVNPEDKNPIEFRGDLNELYWSQSFDLDNRVEDVYISGTDGGTGTVRYSDFPADTPIKAVDVDTDTLLDSNTTDANGQASFDIPLSSHSVSFESYTTEAPTVSNLSPTGTIRYEDTTLSADIDDANFNDGETVDVTFTLNGSVVHTETISSAQTVTASVSGLNDADHTFEVEATDSSGLTTTDSVTFTVDHYDPTATNLSPTGALDYEPTSLEADIADKDFPLDGDSLTVDIYLDSTLIDTQTIGANQTVSTSIPQSGQDGGSHTYRFNVTDSYGNSIDESASYSVPDTFTIRNELNHSEIVDDPVNSTVVFFGTDETYERFTTDGTINMTNLPVNQDFIVEVQPSDGNWTDRVVYVNSIYEQQSAYVLNTSETSTIQARFTLNDQTGQYDSSSVLKIQRSINISGNQVWQTVHADEFGVEGVQATLDEGVRHRIVIRDEDGNEQVVGPYRAEQSEEVVVEPGAASIDLGEFIDGVGTNAEMDGQTVEYRFSSPNEEVDELTVTIHRKNDESDVLYQQSYFNIKNASDSFSISQNESERRYIVKYEYSIDGEDYTITDEIGNQPELFSALGSNWQAIIGVGSLFLLAGAFSVLNATVGAVVVALMGGILWWIGLFGTATTGIFVVLAVLVGVALHMAKAGGP